MQRLTDKHQEGCVVTEGICQTTGANKGEGAEASICLNFHIFKMKIVVL